MKERIEYIDLAKGICILLVVLDHISDSGYFRGGNYPLNDIFEQTRMPLYFILSGLFFKDYPGGIREFLLRKTNRILVPYLFFMLLYRVAGRLLLLLTGFNAGPVWLPLWFLLCLFWMNVIFATLYYIIKKLVPSGPAAETALALCVFATGIGGYLAGNLPLSIGTAMTSLPFLWMGYLLSRKLNFFGLRLHRALALSIAIGLFAVLHFLYCGDNYFYLNTYQTPLPLVYLSGLLGTLAILLLSRSIGWLPVVAYVGRFSIIVLCTHMAVVKGVVGTLTLIPQFGAGVGTVQSLLVLVLTTVCCMGLCRLLSRYLPWFTAQKDLFRPQKATGKQK